MTETTIPDSRDRPRTNKKAVLAFVFGLFTVVYWFSILPAVVLWRLALRDSRREPNQKGIRLAWAGVVVGTTSIVMTAVVIYWFLVPALFRGYQTRNAAEAVSIVQGIRDSLNRFNQRYGGFPGSLQELVEADLLHTNFAQEVINNYRFSYRFPKEPVQVRDGRPLYSKFILVAEPRVFYVAREVYYLDESGAISSSEYMEPDGRVETVAPPPANWRRPTSIKKE